MAVHLQPPSRLSLWPQSTTHRTAPHSSEARTVAPPLVRRHIKPITSSSDVLFSSPGVALLLANPVSCCASHNISLHPPRSNRVVKSGGTPGFWLVFSCTITNRTTYLACETMRVEFLLRVCFHVWALNSAIAYRAKRLVESVVVAMTVRMVIHDIEVCRLKWLLARSAHKASLVVPPGESSIC